MSRSRFEKIALAALALSVVLPAAALSLASATPARADPGDPPGWSVAVDPRGRAFLKYVEKGDGPRLLVLGCLRDVDTFLVTSEAIGGPPEGGPSAELVLSVPDGDYVVQGKVETGSDGAPSFTAELDADAAALRKIGRELLPVLKATGPVVLQVSNGEPVDIPLAAVGARIGITEPLKRFEKVCFSGK